MTVTSQDVANQAIELMGGNQPPVTGYAPSFDDSTTGQALQKLYGPCVATVARQFGWDFARTQAALTPSGNSPPAGWAEEYLYPSQGVEVWQLLPPTLADPNAPLPINWAVGNAEVSSVQTKVIWSNLSGALAAYNNNPAESTWDPGFRESVVRLLASELALALAGKPDLAENYLQSGAAFESIGEGRPD